MKKLKPNEYECDHCHNVYKKGWSDEEAEKESEELWGVKNASEKLDSGMAIICDDCFKKIT